MQLSNRSETWPELSLQNSEGWRRLGGKAPPGRECRGTYKEAFEAVQRGSCHPSGEVGLGSQVAPDRGRGNGLGVASLWPLYAGRCPHIAQASKGPSPGLTRSPAPRGLCEPAVFLTGQGAPPRREGKGEEAGLGLDSAVERGGVTLGQDP